MSEKASPNYDQIKMIAFDADDTLFVNETYFRETEDKFVELMMQYETPNNINHELINLETARLPLYGYGIKGFILVLVECAIKISNNTVSPQTIQKILDFGQTMLNKPIELLEGVEETLKALSDKDKYRIIVITKGDLLDQERKLDRSGLSRWFHHVEVVSEKAPSNYTKLLKQLDCPVEEFLMVGNSLKSDVLPLLEIGAKAIHVPFHTTWAHETVHEDATKDKEFHTLSTVREILSLLPE